MTPGGAMVAAVPVHPTCSPLFFQSAVPNNVVPPLSFADPVCSSICVFAVRCCTAPRPLPSNPSLRSDFSLRSPSRRGLLHVSYATPPTYGQSFEDKSLLLCFFYQASLASYRPKASSIWSSRTLHAPAHVHPAPSSARRRSLTGSRSCATSRGSGSSTRRFAWCSPRLNDSRRFASLCFCNDYVTSPTFGSLRHRLVPD